MGRFLGSTRNGVIDLGCGLELVYSDAVLARARIPGIDMSHTVYPKNVGEMPCSQYQISVPANIHGGALKKCQYIWYSA